RYVRSEQQSQRACGPQPEGAGRRRARIGFVAAPRRCPTSTSSRRLASARPALAPKCEFISARALSSFWCETSPAGATQESPGRKPWEQGQYQGKRRRGDAVGSGIIDVPYDEYL